MPNQDGSSALIIAVLKDRIECVRLLLESGADKDATDNVRRAVDFRICIVQFRFFFWLEVQS
jgi:ankyrin repeat protein